MKHVIYISGKPKPVLLHIRRLNSFKVSNKVKEYKRFMSCTATVQSPQSTIYYKFDFI